MFLTVFNVFLTGLFDLGLLAGIKLLNGPLTLYKAAFNSTTTKKINLLNAYIKKQNYLHWDRFQF